jgi:hypothetical protein
MAAPMRATSTPGVYARGSRWVAVYRQDGRQRKESTATFRAAREIKIRADAKEAARRAGPTLHSYALEWIDHYAGRGAHDVINDRTRREYRRLLIAHALAYFVPEERLRDLDEQRVRGFVDWLCRQRGAGFTPPRSPSIRTATCSATISARTSTLAWRSADRWPPVTLVDLRRRAIRPRPLT